MLGASTGGDPGDNGPSPGYLEGNVTRLSPRTRRELRKKLHRLTVSGGKFEVGGVDLPLETAVEEFIRLHRTRGQVKGWTTNENPAAREFLRQVARAFHEVGHTRLTFLRVGAERVAADLSFFNRLNRIAYRYQCGLAPGHWARWSPGIVLRFRVLGDAIASGMRAYDETAGAQPYLEAFSPTR
jgi:CelD/BcsL family acetyltransferase involved in cellulose biosynthesis